MMLISRLKHGIEVSRPAASRRHWPVAAFKMLIMLSLLNPGVNFAFAAVRNCPVEALSALPDKPVSVQRVERNDEGRILVSWSLTNPGIDDDGFEEPARLQTGAEFDLIRCLPPGRLVAVGKGEVSARNGSTVEGLLSVAGIAPSVDRGVADELVSSGNLYPTPMVGDLVVVRRKEISEVKKIVPRVTVPASSLFESQSSRNGQMQMELSQTGRDSLRQLLSSNFAQARGRLLIEVHAQRAGSRQRLRDETLQRAESIERFLRYEFGIDKSQILAVGHGADSYVSGFVPANAPRDFVVLRMLPGSLGTH
ncbi:MAG: OmpA family protein [Silvanigrellaceae bacterium]